MCFIRKTAVAQEDGTEKVYGFKEVWNGFSGVLDDNYTLELADLTQYRINAKTIGQDKTLTLDWTKLRDITPGRSRVSIATGINPLRVKFHNEHGDWYCIKKDVDFYSDPVTFEVDRSSVVLKGDKRYLIEFFDSHITVEEYFDPEIMITLPDGS